MKRFGTIKTSLEKYPLLPALLSMGWNLAYAVFNGVLGFCYASRWYITLCAYYLVLGIMRLSAVTVQKSRKRTEASVMRTIGIGMLPLAVVISAITFFTILEQQNPVRNRIVMITIATYTFALVAWSVRNIVRAHRQKSAMMITLRNISCAAATGSILSLERGMLGTFGNAADSFTRTTEIVSGAAAFVLILGLGLDLILQSGRYEP